MMILWILFILGRTDCSCLKRDLPKSWNVFTVQKVTTVGTVPEVLSEGRILFSTQNLLKLSISTTLPKLNRAQQRVSIVNSNNVLVTGLIIHSASTDKNQLNYLTIKTDCPAQDLSMGEYYKMYLSSEWNKRKVIIPKKAVYFNKLNTPSVLILSDHGDELLERIISIEKSAGIHYILKEGIMPGEVLVVEKLPANK